MLVEGRACLVVGGATVAGRKTEALVEAGAKVTIVAPELGERVMALQFIPGVRIIQRRSRLIKEHLARQVATLEKADMIVMGTAARQPRATTNVARNV